MDDRGYLGLFRKFFDHEFWKEKRKFSKAEAWIDLMRSARYGENPERLFDKRGEYTLEHGDIYISLRYLGERWQWSKNKVRHFLDTLERLESISVKKRDSHRTIIHVTNLKAYTEWIQGKRDKKDSEGTVKGQSRDSEGTKKKKVKKVKKVKVKGIATDSPCIEDFNPSEATVKVCKDLSVGQKKFKALAECCFDHFRSKGEKRVDWQATVRNWIKRDKEMNFGKRSPDEEERPPNYAGRVEK